MQQCYNIADTLIVGGCLGANALAAVGSAFTLMTFLTSIGFMVCTGVKTRRDYLHIEGAFYCGIGCLFLLDGLYRALGMELFSFTIVWAMSAGDSFMPLRSQYSIIPLVPPAI